MVFVAPPFWLATTIVLITNPLFMPNQKTSFLVYLSQEFLQKLDEETLVIKKQKIDEIAKSGKPIKEKAFRRNDLILEILEEYAAKKGWKVSPRPKK